MNVLIVCPYFPPENVIAALRIGKFAEHLERAGDCVHVVTRAMAGEAEEGAYDSKHNLVVHRFPDPVRAVKEKLESGAARHPTVEIDPCVSKRRPLPRSVWRSAHGLALALRDWVLWPDPLNMWGINAVRRLDLGDWVPDVVVGSAGPLSAFFVASRVARKYQVPWVADYRDPLSISPYLTTARAHRLLTAAFERRIVHSASDVVAVSQPLANDLARQHGRTVGVVRNGFDPADFSSLEPTGAPDSELVVSYCGELYDGKRDPAPLFAAVRKLLDEGLKLKVRFFGSNVDLLADKVKNAGILEAVEFHGRVSHQESLKIQATSDVLLLLMWNSPSDRGTMSGKIYEYVGARRPILMLGYEGGAAAGLIRERRLGIVANNPTEIALAIKRWAVIKRETGIVPALPLEGLAGMTRQEQSEVLRSRLTMLVEKAGQAGRS